PPPDQQQVGGHEGHLGEQEGGDHRDEGGIAVEKTRSESPTQDSSRAAAYARVLPARGGSIPADHTHPASAGTSSTCVPEARVCAPNSWASRCAAATSPSATRQDRAPTSHTCSTYVVDPRVGVNARRSNNPKLSCSSAWSRPRAAYSIPDSR